jgi:hypothetical protein
MELSHRGVAKDIPGPGLLSPWNGPLVREAVLPKSPAADPEPLGLHNLPHTIRSLLGRLHLIYEIGSYNRVGPPHDELIERNGAYARLSQVQHYRYIPIPGILQQALALLFVSVQPSESLTPAACQEKASLQ